MTDLVDFVLARIAEDEERCSQEIADGHGWQHETGWPPYRVFAECDAKRRIVGEFGTYCSDYLPPGDPHRIEREAEAAEMGWVFQAHWPEQYAPFCDGCAAAQSADNDHGRVLRLLALPYADHADYRQEWRV